VPEVNPADLGDVGGIAPSLGTGPVRPSRGTLPVVILAGGLATRMRPRTENLPKALLPVNGRPFADIQLEWLSSLGVTDVVYSIAHLGDLIREHIGDGERFGLRVQYVPDGEHTLGTGGALRRVIDSGAVPERFGVINGDSFLTLDLPAIESSFAASGCPALMTVMRNRNRWDASNAIYSQGRVVVYDKSRPARWREAMEWIDYGFSVLDRCAITDFVASGQTSDISDILRSLSLAGQLAGFEVDARFYEIGSEQGLRDLERHLA
jgi:NDP-sugar pyrophosphorylase family protein